MIHIQLVLFFNFILMFWRAFTHSTVTRSNDQRASVVSNHRPIQKRITVKGDGQCFFRRIIAFTTDDPQIVGSKSDDRYTPQLLDIKEGVLANGLRASLMAYTIEHISELNALLGPNPIDELNADVLDNVIFFFFFFFFLVQCVLFISMNMSNE